MTEIDIKIKCDNNDVNVTINGGNIDGGTAMNEEVNSIDGGAA